MNLFRYLWDKIIYLFSWGACALISWLYLMGLGVAPDGVRFVIILIAVSGLVPLLLDYWRRNSWYRGMQARFDELDQKYLFHEVIESPGFMDGMIFENWLKEMAHSMNERVAHSEQMTREYQDYLELWVHEIKTPIATALLTAENHPSPQMRSIQDELTRIESCVMQVLYYARSASLQDDYIITRCSLQSLVDAALKRNARLLIRSGFTIDKGPLDDEVYTDSKWMGFVLDQIIQNAVKYRNDDRGVLRFRQEDSKDACELLVEDEGIGVPAADLPRLFQKGFTGENGRRFTKATGMGLYISKNLMEKMGLRIRAQNGSEGGLLIRMHFPKNSMYDFSA